MGKRGRWLVSFIVLLFVYSGSVRAESATEGFDSALSLVFGQEAQEVITSDRTEQIIYKMTMPNDGKLQLLIQSSAAISVGIYSADGNKLDYMNDFYYASMDAPAKGYYIKTMMAGDYYLVIQNWFNSSGYVSILMGDFSAQSITLDHTELTVTKGESFTLNATVLPENAENKDVKWSSSNSDVVYAYDSGKLSAWSAGQATITVSSDDNQDVKASCVVTVLPEAPENVRLGSSSKVKQKSFEITWNKAGGASGYKVYLYNKKSKRYKLYKDVKKNSCVIKNLKADTAYKIQVSAYVSVSSKKLEGKRSETLKQYTAPKAPKATKITRIKQGSRIHSARGTIYYYTVSWEKVKGATGYTVYVKHQNSRGWQRLTDTKNTTEQYYAGYGFKYYFAVASYRTKHGITTYAKKSRISVINLEQ